VSPVTALLADINDYLVHVSHCHSLAYGRLSMKRSLRFLVALGLLVMCAVELRAQDVTQAAAVIATPSGPFGAYNAMLVDQPPVSLEQRAADTSHDLADQLEDSRAVDPFENVTDENLRQSVGELMGILTDRERRVLELRFGFTDGCSHTLDQIGKLVSLSRERVRQIEKTALGKLKRADECLPLKGFLNYDVEATCGAQD